MLQIKYSFFCIILLITFSNLIIYYLHLIIFYLFIFSYYSKYIFVILINNPDESFHVHVNMSFVYFSVSSFIKLMFSLSVSVVTSWQLCTIKCVMAITILVNKTFFDTYLLHVILRQFILLFEHYCMFMYCYLYKTYNKICT